MTDELARIANVPTDQVSLNAIGPSWGSDITNKAIEAVVVFLVLISISIAIYFETKMAIAALVALVHDMLITIGIYALSGFQVSPDTVIAFLTVLGYSLYDTIVVFDKVKENTVGLASTNRVTYTDVVNLSMNQVLARSINTSFVAVMPVFCIFGRRVVDPRRVGPERFRLGAVHRPAERGVLVDIHCLAHPGVVERA